MKSDSNSFFLSNLFLLGLSLTLPSMAQDIGSLVKVDVGGGKFKRGLVLQVNSQDTPPSVVVNILNEKGLFVRKLVPQNLFKDASKVGGFYVIGKDEVTDFKGACPEIDTPSTATAPSTLAGQGKKIVSRLPHDITFIGQSHWRSELDELEPSKKTAFINEISASQFKICQTILNKIKSGAPLNPPVLFCEGLAHDIDVFDVANVLRGDGEKARQDLREKYPQEQNLRAREITTEAIAMATVEFRGEFPAEGSLPDQYADLTLRQKILLAREGCEVFLLSFLHVKELKATTEYSYECRTQKEIDELKTKEIEVLERMEKDLKKARADLQNDKLGFVEMDTLGKTFALKNKLSQCMKTNISTRSDDLVLSSRERQANLHISTYMNKKKDEQGEIILIFGADHDFKKYYADKSNFTSIDLR